MTKPTKSTLPARVTKQPEPAVKESSGQYSALSQEDVTEYNKVVSVARLQTILLTHNSFETRPSILKVDLRSGSKGDGPTPRFWDEMTGVTIDATAGIAIGENVWELTVGSEDERHLRLEAKFVVIYSNVDGCAESAVERFVRNVGRFAVFPYFRGLVSQLSWLSQSDLPPLPVLRGPPPVPPPPKPKRRRATKLSDSEPIGTEA